MRPRKPFSVGFGNTTAISNFAGGTFGREPRHLSFIEMCRQRHIEELVSKHRDRRYRGGRFEHWIKVKNRKHPAMSQEWRQVKSKINPAGISLRQ
jgi:hypothetical protein